MWSHMTPRGLSEKMTPGMPKARQHQLESARDSAASSCGQADMLNALANVRFRGKATATNRCLPISNARPTNGVRQRLIGETYATAPTQQYAVIDDFREDATPARSRARSMWMLPGPLLSAARNAQWLECALRSGILLATSPIIATMDGDGQNDPRDIARLLEVLWEPGTDGPAFVGGGRSNANPAVPSVRPPAQTIGSATRLLLDDCPDTGCGNRSRTWCLFFTSTRRYCLQDGRVVDYVSVTTAPAGQCIKR